ncbi:MAG TPA: BON domain-containing protein [Bryobacteraceae bacterium]|nr:BON domain-containing protein [Bryobacteraceae bacterium]
MRRQVAIAAALLFAVTAFSETRAPETHKRAAPSAAPARKSDAQIERDIRARFAKSKINADHFQVRVQGGIAIIEGKTGVIQHKGVATRMAKSAGAIAVENHVEISDAARQKAAANLASGRRRVQVKRSEPRSQQ